MNCLNDMALVSCSFSHSSVRSTVLMTFDPDPYTGYAVIIGLLQSPSFQFSGGSFQCKKRVSLNTAYYRAFCKSPFYYIDIAEKVKQ